MRSWVRPDRASRRKARDGHRYEPRRGRSHEGNRGQRCFTEDIHGRYQDQGHLPNEARGAAQGNAVTAA